MFSNNIRVANQSPDLNSILVSGGETYGQKILSTLSNVYAIYPGNETGVTTTALETVNGYNGTLNGPTLGAIAGPGASMGNAAFYDGLVDYCQLPAASLDGPFDPNLGTMMVWLRVFNAGVWTDGAVRFLIALGADNSNKIQIHKSAAANSMVYTFVAGASTLMARTVSLSNTNWNCFGITWSKSANRIRPYLNGIQQGADVAYTTNWSGSLTNNFAQLMSILGGLFMHGYPSFAVFSSAEATATQMATLAIAV